MLISIGRIKAQSKHIFTYFERSDNANSSIIEEVESKKKFKFLIVNYLFIINIK